MGRGLLLVDVVEVVRHDERDPGLGRETEELLVQDPLLGQAVVLELEEEVALAEDVAVLAGESPGGVPVLDLERPRDLAAETGAQPDEALGVTGEVLAVDPRPVVVAVDVGVGDEPAEVAVADEVLREEDQVEGLGVGLALLLGHRPAGDVGLDADDRLDPLRLRRLVEGDGAVEGAVVGQGEAVEALRGGRIDEVRDPPEPVEEAELRVGVEVREVVRGEGRHGGSMVAGDPGSARETPGDGHGLRCRRGRRSIEGGPAHVLPDLGLVRGVRPHARRRAPDRRASPFGRPSPRSSASWRSSSTRTSRPMSRSGTCSARSSRSAPPAMSSSSRGGRSEPRRCSTPSRSAGCPRDGPSRWRSSRTRRRSPSAALIGRQWLGLVG